jgi:hypothetical protein
MALLIELGNNKVVQRITADDGSVDVQKVKGDRVTYIGPFAEDTSIGDAFRDVTDPRGAWAAHAQDGAKPTWVHVEGSQGLQDLLAEHFGCASGRPSDIEATHHTISGPPGIGPDGPLDSK